MKEYIKEKKGMVPPFLYKTVGFLSVEHMVFSGQVQMVLSVK